MPNPLSKFYRSPALYTSLPSGTSYYSSDQVEFTESGEVAVYPMTLSDEILLKNPDALLNGEAIASVISNCVPGVKKPKDLLSNDNLYFHNFIFPKVVIPIAISISSSHSSSE